MNTPEDLFKDSFSGFEKEPSQKVWQNIEKRLAWQRFWKFDFKTFNVWYLTAIGLIIGGTVYNIYDLQKNISSAKNARKNSDVNIIKRNEQWLANAEQITPITIDKTREEKINFIQQLISPDTAVESEKTNEELRQQSDIKIANRTENKEIEIPEFSANFKISDTAGCAPLTVAFKNLSKNTDYCYWNFGNGEVSYDNDGKTTYTKPGRYVVTLKTVNGTFSKNFTDTVTVYSQPEAQIAYVVSSKTVLAEARDSKASTFSWDFGDGNKSVGEKVMHTYNSFGSYPLNLIVSNNICVDTVTAALKLSPQEYSINFPNALSNEIPFLPKGDIDDISRYSLKIMTRNRKEIFTSTDPLKGWDGYYKGEKVPKGVYIYICQYEFFNGERGNLTGNVTVMWE
ncbi:MAG: PKD domain-containing protein [Bacteroidales bacterium]|nr:PKD domain-containing protein [Bacteroidales bacterium]